MKKPSTSCTSPLVWAATLLTSAGGVVANYTDATNKRFTDAPTFIGNNVVPPDGFDLSGVGRISSPSPADSVNYFREGSWATAIGANYFLSARHYYPDAGSEITFTAGNSISSPSFTYEVGGGFQVGSTDLWIGYTLQEIAPSIARYAYTTQSANNLSDLGLGNSTLYMSGDSLAGRPGLVEDHVLGTNQAESFYDEGSSQFLSPGTIVSFTPPTNFENDMIILFEDEIGDDAAPLVHEAVVRSGDSGSPLFSASGTTLTILGVGSLLVQSPGNFIDTAGPVPDVDPLETREGSFYSYAGSYTDEIATAIALVPAPIPEPSSIFFIAIATSLGLRRKR